MVEKTSGITAQNELVIDRRFISMVTLKEKAYLTTKRIFDILASIIAIILTSPIFLITSLAILATDFGPAIYTQTRIGKNGKLFKIYKFRSMKTNSAEILKELLKDPKIAKEWKNNHKLDNDPRITKIGKFIRKFSIDELPQLFNVLKGDMSLIGPRPLVEGEIESYKGNKETYQCMRPGLTGWWAANGRSNLTTKERLELEYYYVDNCCLKLDAKCIYRTATTLFIKNNAK